MTSDLTKTEKKLSRELIGKGLQQEYQNAIRDLDAVITAWKNKTTDNRNTYMALYRKLDEHDTHIARRYNGMRGSMYLDTVAVLLRDGLITKEDIAGFSDENRAYLMRYLGI